MFCVDALNILTILTVFAGTEEIVLDLICLVADLP